MKRRLFLGATAGVAAGASGAALVVGSRPAEPDARSAGPRGADGREKFPNVPLLTRRGERVRFYDDMIRGNHVNVLTVMYTQCPEICGGTMVNLVRMQALLGERMGREVRFISLTLDPRRDSPRVLARYAGLLGAGAHWTFLTGQPEHVERLRRVLRFADRNPEIDRDLTQHTGMVRIGNDALDRWAACPGAIGAVQMVREVGWIGLAADTAA